MASGQVTRIQRPNTWLLRPALQRTKVSDNPEPSTHTAKYHLAVAFKASEVKHILADIYANRGKYLQYSSCGICHGILMVSGRTSKRFQKKP
jgi:hypothetical protein